MAIKHILLVRNGNRDEIRFQLSQETSNRFSPDWDDPESAFTLAYESMLKASMALMFSQGYRPRVQLGHHKTLIKFSKYVLGDTYAGMTATYDHMRGKRNRVVYDVGAVSEAEVKEALSMAEKYLNVIRQKIEEDNPQMKLL